MNTPDTAPGGERRTLALDMSNPKDQAMVRSFATRRKKRWAALDEEKKTAIVNDLDRARHVASTILDGAVDSETSMFAIGAISSIAKTMAVIEGQNQKDEHADQEQATANAPKVIEHRHYVVKPPRLLGEG